MIALLAQVATSLAHIEFPITQTHIALLPASHSDSLPVAQVSINLTDAPGFESKQSKQQFLDGFPTKKFFRSAESSYAMEIDYQTPFAYINVQVFVGEDFFA